MASAPGSASSVSAASVPAAPLRPKSKVRPTLEGLCWLGVALILLSQGWLRSVNLVALLACFLIALLLVNYLWVSMRFRLKRLQPQRRVAEPVFARQTFAVTLEVDNPFKLPQPGLRLVDQGRHHDHAWFLPLLRRSQHTQSEFRVTLPRRGRYRWPPLVLSTGYPFGLVRRTVTHDTDAETIVLPSLGTVHRGRLRRLLQSRVQMSSSPRRPIHRLPGSQAEFHGLREFRSGDSPRWIHWRTTARVGDLMVREFEEPPYENLILVLEPWLPVSARELQYKLHQVVRDNERRWQMLSSRPPRSADHGEKGALIEREEVYRWPWEMLERAVSLAATICWEWCRNPGARLALIVAGQEPEVRVTDTGMTQVLPLLRSLAVVQGHPETNTATLQRLLNQVPLPGGPVLLITPRETTLDQFLTPQVGRPVTVIDVTQPMVNDFYEDPAE